MQCSVCQKEYANEYSLKTHMTNMHGGFSVDQLKASGIKPSRKDIARSLAGNTSASEVTGQAPEKEPGVGDSAPIKRTRKSKESTDPAVEAAKEQIIRLRCQRMASLPYTLLANLMGEPAIKLNEQEESMLTESYVTLAKAYGWEGTSKLLLWGDVFICQAAIVAAPDRKEAIFNAVGMIGQPEAVAEQTENPKADDTRTD
jgi:hypothetical protein